MYTLKALLLSITILVATPVMAKDAIELARGKALFNVKTVPACALCHTLRDAGSTGEVGPALDDIKPSAQRVLNAMKNGLGQMPSFATTLSEADLQALALYVSKASGGSQ